MAALSLAAGVAACGDDRPAAHRGLYVFGPEVEAFIPCGSNDPYWVRTPNRIWDQLRAETLDRVTEPFHGIYVDVQGFYSGPPNEETDGIVGTDYDETFTITAVSLIQTEPFANCPVTR